MPNIGKFGRLSMRALTFLMVMSHCCGSPVQPISLLNDSLSIPCRMTWSWSVAQKEAIKLLIDKIIIPWHNCQLDLERFDLSIALTMLTQASQPMELLHFAVARLLKNHVADDVVLHTAVHCHNVHRAGLAN
eukprot:1469202-Amphidinium_carterae.1